MVDIACFVDLYDFDGGMSTAAKVLPLATTSLRAQLLPETFI